MSEWILVALGVAVVLLLVGGGLVWRRARLPGPTPEREIAPVNPVAARFAEALRRTREALGGSLRSVFGRERMDEGAWQELEEILLRADVGARTSLALVEELKKSASPDTPPAELRERLGRLIEARIGQGTHRLATVPAGPLVILVVGVNGSGKTTTIGKLAGRYKAEGKTVLLGAGDTFRAGAIEQLKVWGERAGVPVVAHQEGADPAAVCHDAVQSAIAKGIDVVICDTAGRLQAHATLMDELAKVRRVIGKVRPGAPHETLLVLDGTMGQNALSQARIFGEVAGVTGIVLTKLDGTAKGGVVVAIHEELHLPVKLVGLGEKMEDLRDFDAAAFSAALFGGSGV
jgi:fused signal recognition particle receptor